uniref:Uncharacterized protein n=1 Tax=Romanomermis culicivorax TaxID=13658 RepID=A0A915IFN5_ROMCU
MNDNLKQKRAINDNICNVQMWESVGSQSNPRITFTWWKDNLAMIQLGGEGDNCMTVIQR